MLGKLFLCYIMCVIYLNVFRKQKTAKGQREQEIRDWAKAIRMQIQFHQGQSPMDAKRGSMSNVYHLMKCYGTQSPQ